MTRWEWLLFIPIAAMAVLLAYALLRFWVRVIGGGGGLAEASGFPLDLHRSLNMLAGVWSGLNPYRRISLA